VTAVIIEGNIKQSVFKIRGMIWKDLVSLFIVSSGWWILDENPTY